MTAQDVSVGVLTTEYQVAPFPLATTRPRFGWQLLSEDHGVTQRAYEILVTSPAHDADRASVVWSSGRTADQASVHIVYGGPALRPRTRYHWSVRVWVDEADPTPWSEEAWFETGLDEEGWVATWVEPDQARALREPPFNPRSGTAFSTPVDHSLLRPTQLLRREFHSRPGLVRARLYATSHGIYEAHINGLRVGDLELTPETTAYAEMLMYQAYDVTDMVRAGPNALGFEVADGWWAGRLGMYGGSVNYGDTLGLLAQLMLEFDDGTTQTIATDESFRSSTGPTQYADLLVGQRTDARLSHDGWTRPGYDDTNWAPVQATVRPGAEVVAQRGEPVRVVAELPCTRVLPTPDGGQILDFGQLVAGRVRIDLTDVDAGTEVTLQHFSVLGPDGDFFDSINGRNNENTDIYIARGGGETFEPRLTFHAFQFVKVTGLAHPLEPSAAVAKALSSDLQPTFHLTTSDPRVDQLHSNIAWTLRDNLVSIPTDNPDRERAGWTGDLGVIAHTTAVYFGVDQFLTRFADNLRIEQLADGTVPMVIPNFGDYKELLPQLLGVHSCAAWGDVAVIAPWQTYQAYGDIRILQNNYESATRFHKSVTATAAATVTDEDRADPDLATIWRVNAFHFGDWLAPSTTGKSPDKFYDGLRGLAFNALIPTLYHAHSTELLSRWAAAIGRAEEADALAERADRIKQGFRKAFVTQDDLLTVDTQGNYVLALAFDMVPELRTTFASRLRELIAANDGRLDTGFLSSAYLLPVLSDNGLNDLAYSLLLQDEYPSWLFMVAHDATTVWEWWQGIEPDGEPNRASFSQPGLTTVGSWLATHVAGINAAGPGYRTVRLHPRPNARLAHIAGEYSSVHGVIRSEWTIADDRIDYWFQIPANVEATLVLDDLAESEIEVVAGKGHATVIPRQDATSTSVSLSLTSGSFRVTAPWRRVPDKELPATRAPAPDHGEGTGITIGTSTTIEDWLEHSRGGPALRELLERRGMDGSMLEQVRHLTLGTLLAMSGGVIDPVDVDGLVAEANPT